MSKQLITGLLLACFLLPEVRPQAGTPEHPYLLFNEAGKAAMMERIACDQDAARLKERILLEAYRYLMMPVDEEHPQGGDRSRFYAGNAMGRYTGRHMQAALNLAFAYQLTGEEDYARKSFRHAELLCRLETWTHPFHEFPQIYDRVWPWNVDDDQVVFSFDIGTARIASHLALVYDWIYSAMDKGQRDRIRGALLEKAITRVRGNWDFHWWSAAHRCNWSGICYSGAGLASMALLREDPVLSDVVEEAYHGLCMMLDELGPDGGWQEGRGYWSFGLSHSLWFMDALKNMRGEDYNLFLHPRLKDNPADFPLYTLPAAFGDGRGGPVGSSWFLNKLAAETGSHTAAWYSREFLVPQESLFDLIWPVAGVEAIEPEIKSKHFRGIDWATMQSSFKAGCSFSVSCKAGLNDDPHHGHLDCGSYILNYAGIPFIRDPKHAGYDDYYFSAQRWDYAEASSRGHNVISVNGEEQMIAREKDGPWKEGVGGSIVEFVCGDSMDYLVMGGLEKAYPGKELLSWQRHLVLDKPSMLIVLDRVEARAGAEIRSRIMPGGELNSGNGHATIGAEGERLVILPFSSGTVVLEEGRLGSIAVKEDVDFRWLSCLDLVMQAGEGESICGYLVFPATGDPGAEVRLPRISLEQGAGGRLRLHVQQGDKEYDYDFK